MFWFSNRISKEDIIFFLQIAIYKFMNNSDFCEVNFDDILS